MDPVLFAVDEDRSALDVIERELIARYSQSYRVVCVSSAEEAVTTGQRRRSRPMSSS